MTNKEFIKKIGPIIQRMAMVRGYRFPSAIIAQACLESGYGKSKLASAYNNFFGMKCGKSWKGKRVNMRTKEEYVPGVLTTINDDFRAYDTMEEGVKGYFDFISSRRYSNLRLAVSNLDYLEKLKADGYATSSKYIKKVYEVIEKCDLSSYDNFVAAKMNDTEDISKVALEVIRGTWGIGPERKRRLIEAGYDYDEVQSVVNEILRR